MHSLKLGMAAIVLVVSLGLIVPGSFGGSVSADFSHNPNLDPDDPFTLHCDLDGDSNADTAYVPSHYETTYNFLATANSAEDDMALFDPNRNTLMTQEERIDVLQVDYVALTDVPPGYPSEFTDFTVEWFDEFFADDVYPHGKPPGRKTVRCVNIAPAYVYTNSPAEAALDQEGQIAADVPYSEIDYQLFEIMLSPAQRGAVQAASADNGGTLSATSAADDGKDRQHKAKKGGKHRGKGKHRK